MNDSQAKLADYANVQEALADLCASLCRHAGACSCCQEVAPGDLPHPFARLLVHNRHMTVTLSEFYDRPVELKVLEHRHDDDLYRRKVILTLQGTDRIVEFGVVRINLGFTEPEVRERILERKTPLGDILRSENVLRRIQPHWYLRLSAGCPLLADLPHPPPGPIYGRVGTIYCDGQPAIELLEIVTGADRDATGPTGDGRVPSTP